MVPDGWKQVRIGRVGKVITGSTPPTAVKAHYGGDIPFVSPADLGTRRWISHSAKTVTKSGLSVSRPVPAGSSLFVCIGSTIGKVGQAGRDLVTNQQINAVAPNHLVDANFLYYELCRRSERIASLAGNQAVPLINKSQFSGETIHLPPLPEQRKIAEILSTWDQAIETAQALLATARTQKRALMQSLLTGKRRFPEFEGQDRKEVRLGEICNPKQWSTISSKQMAEEGYPVFGANGHIGWFGEFNHEEPTIAVGCRGVCGSVHLTPPKSYITGNSMALDDLDPSQAILGFVFQYLTYFGFQKIVSGSAQPQITGQAIKSYMLMLPPLDEQRKITAAFAAVETEVKLWTAQIHHLRTEKKALMQQLLTGKRRVKTDA